MLIVLIVKKWASLIRLGKWMYNPATQVQVLTDAELGSYYLSFIMFTNNLMSITALQKKNLKYVTKQ
jgi:hypothetical protein